MRIYLTALILCVPAIVAGRDLIAFAALTLLALLIPVFSWREWKQDVRERRLERLRERRTHISSEEASQ